MSETTNASAASTTEGSQPVAQTTPETASSAPAASTTEQVETPTATETTEAPSTLGAAKEAAREAGETTAAEAPTYDLKSPVEGQELDPELLGKFEGVLTKHKASNEFGQEMLNELVPALNEGQARAIEATVLQWDKELRAHPELGGDNLQATLKTANTAIDSMPAKLAEPLRELLTQTRLEGHPAMVAALEFFGSKLTTDTKVVTGSAPEPEVQKDPVARLAANYDAAAVT